MRTTETKVKIATTARVVSRSEEIRSRLDFGAAKSIVRQYRSNSGTFQPAFRYLGEHGDDVRLEKGASVEVTVTAELER